MPTYYWYDDAIFNLGGGGITSSKGGKSSSWGSSGGKAGKSTEPKHPLWWGAWSAGKARKMTETSEVVIENGEGKPGRTLSRNKKNEEPVVDETNEDDALFYTLNTAMPSAYHTVSICVVIYMCTQYTLLIRKHFVV